MFVDLLDPNSLLAVSLQTLIYYSSTTAPCTYAVLANVIDLRLHDRVLDRIAHRQDQRRKSNVCVRPRRKSGEIDSRTQVVGRAQRAWPGPLLLLRQAVSPVVKAGCMCVRECCVYAMRVGTLMPGNRGCRSHASRWGPVLPDPGIRARPSPFSFSFSRLPASQHLLLPPPFSYVRLSFPLLSQCLFLPLAPAFRSFSLSSFADLGHYIYGRWRYGLPPKRDPNESP